MSSNPGGGPGGREVAYRLFAAEFEDATVSYSESDEERAPNYVVTPTGGRVNRLFLVGVLTETERVGGEQIRARVVDPTGAFVAYAGQYQPDELAFLDRVDPPAFLAITGKARTFSPEDSDRVYTSVRPESISEVDAATRDRWVVQTAEQTLERVSTMASALRSGLHGEELRERLVGAGVEPGLASGVTLAVEHYGTTSAYLRGLRETALDALRIVADERDEVERRRLAPDEGGTDDAVLAGLAGVDLDVVATDVGSSTTGPAAGASAGAERVESPESDGTTATDAGAGAEPAEAETTTPEPETETTESAGSGSAASVESGGTDATGAEQDEDIGEFEPGEFDLPEEEREQIEDEFGTEFETAGEVGPAGEADIETPEPESESEPETVEEATAEVETEEATEVETEPEEGSEAEEEPEPEPEPEPADADVDVAEVTVEVIAELDEGDGADRDAVVSTVTERHGVGPEEVADAIESAMMSGRAYEPSDGRLKAI